MGSEFVLRLFFMNSILGDCGWRCEGGMGIDTISMGLGEFTLPGTSAGDDEGFLILLRPVAGLGFPILGLSFLILPGLLVFLAIDDPVFHGTLGDADEALSFIGLGGGIRIGFAEIADGLSDIIRTFPEDGSEEVGVESDDPVKGMVVIFLVGYDIPHDGKDDSAGPDHGPFVHRAVVFSPDDHGFEDWFLPAWKASSNWPEKNTSSARKASQASCTSRSRPQWDSIRSTTLFSIPLKLLRADFLLNFDFIGTTLNHMSDMSTNNADFLIMSAVAPNKPKKERKKESLRGRLPANKLA
jgi:hypothetical protein